jgi:two-component system, chemotaxis family, CheB/CheR fusion protein
VYVFGKTGRFLEFASGEVKLHFPDMIRPELKGKVSLAIRNATEQHKEVIFKSLQFKEENEIKYLNLIVRPIYEAEAFQKKLLLIIFEEITTFSNSNEGLEKLESKDELEKKFSQLEQELKYTKESLQTTIEELETSNEELKSSNEELQSTNEELQSTNEEIETSKEELQSLNEELSTVNAVLESRIEQLSSANDDIKNLLDNTEIATVFLDKELCIKRYTPRATEIINLIPSDVGRPISHIVSNLRYDSLIEDARNVLHTLEPKINEVMDKNDQWYVVRIIPYRTVTNVIDGVVVTFLNIHAQKKAEKDLAFLEKDLISIQNCHHILLDMLETPAIIINQKKKLVLANKKFLTKFKLKFDNIKNKFIKDLNVSWDDEQLNILADELINSTHELKELAKSNHMVAYRLPPFIVICFGAC